MPVAPPRQREVTIYDMCDDLLCHVCDPRGPQADIPREKLDAIKRKASDREDYILNLEMRCRRLEDLVNDHLRTCPAPTEPMLNQRTNFLRNSFRQDTVVCADPRSGKSTAIYETASEIADQCSCRVAIVSAHKDVHKAEAVRRRLSGTGLNQLNRLDFFGPNEIEKMRGFCNEVVVDEWFDLPITTRAVLASNFKVLAAVGSVPFGTLMRINKDGSASVSSSV